MHLKFVIIILVCPITSLIMAETFVQLCFFIFPFFVLAKRQLELVLEFAVLIVGSAYHLQ